MATSGITSFNPDIAELIEESYERAGLEMKTGYDLKTAIRSLNYIATEWANRGINLWTMDQATLPLVAGTDQYALPADTVDVVDGALRVNAGLANQSDVVISRISHTQYLQIPNKKSQGRPLQYFVERKIAPTVTFWRVPDSVQTYTFVYWRMRRIQDAGAVGNTADIPVRFLDALTAGLAWRIAAKRPEAMDRVPMLQAVYEQTFDLATQGDMDRNSFRIIPGGYRW